MSNRIKLEAEDPFRSVEYTAVQLGVEEKTVRNWIAKGQIPYKKILDGAIRIRQTVIDQIIADADKSYLEKRGVRSTKPGVTVAAARAG